MATTASSKGLWTGGHQITRRAFVRSIGLAAGTSALAPFIAACSKSKSATNGSGQVLTIVNPEPNFLDPQQAAFSDDIAVIKQMYRGLLYIDRTQPENVIPAAATQVPSTANGGISADGLTYTLHLRSDLVWQDGSHLTAKDFEYGIKRLFDPQLASDYASFYFNITGAEAYNSAFGTKAAPKKPSTDELNRLRNAVGVQATNDQMLVVKLLQPQPSFNTLLSLWPVSPVQKAQIDKYGDKAFAEASRIVGNGPFKLTEWVHKDHMTLEQNSHWWGEDKPSLGKIVMKDIEDDTVAFTAFKNGELDLAIVPLVDVDVVAKDPVLSKQNVRADSQDTYVLAFDVARVPFDDVNVRRAFSEAIDRDSLIKNVRQGIGKPAYSWLPPGVPDYDPSLGQEYKFDTAKARSDLARSKYGTNLPPMKLTIGSSASEKLQAQFIQSQLQTNLGAKVDLEVLDSAAYKGRYQQGDFQMVVDNWQSDYADPEDWLPELFGTNGGNNKYKYSNPQVDQMFKSAKATANDTQRLAAYKTAHQLIVADQPMVFLYYDQTNFVVKPWVQGLVTTGLDGLPGDWFFTDVSISSH